MSEIPKELLAKVMKWRSFPRERPDYIERAGPGQESVWDYPRPPRVEQMNKAIQVEFGGQIIANSTNTLRVIETSGPPVYYIPPEDVRIDLLAPSKKTTLCEWKGVSRYWHVVVGELQARNAAWAYPDPWNGYEKIRSYLAFNAGLMDACFVDGEKVIPQPGHYYGGWITSDIVGPFKGGPGTERW